MKNLATKLVVAVVVMFFWNVLDASGVPPDEVTMIDRNGAEVMTFEKEEFGFNLRYERDPHTAHTYRICSGSASELCAIDFDGIALPYVIGQGDLDIGDTWRFDGASFEVVRGNVEAPERFTSCSRLYWVLAETETYSHEFAYSRSCGVIGGCFDWRDSDICYWSSERAGLSLDPKDYRKRDLLTNRQVESLQCGLMSSDNRESFAIRMQCLDDDALCPTK